MVDTFTVTLSVILTEVLIPDHSILQPFVSNFIASLRDLFISVNVDPVSRNAQVSNDLPVHASVICTLTIGSKAKLDGIL